MQVTRILIKRRIAPYTRYMRERVIDVSEVDIKDIIDMLINEFFKIYAEELRECRTPRRLARFRNSMHFENLRMSIDGVGSVELASHRERDGALITF